MKVIICFILFFLILKNTLIADDFKIPFKKENLKAIYKIDNGNWIYIQSFERGDRIWERKKNSKEIKEISIVYNFIAIAEECEFIRQNNIYFALLKNSNACFADNFSLDGPTLTYKSESFKYACVPFLIYAIYTIPHSSRNINQISFSKIL